VTGAWHEQVDLGRLADYLGGALEGTPDAETVAELIEADPVWSAAYHELVSADAAVRSDLRVLASAPEPVPADLAARIGAALNAPAPPIRPAPRLTVVRGETGAPPTAGARPTHRPPRSRRWATVTTVAAAVVLIGFGAVTVLPHLLTAGDRSASTSAPGYGDLNADSGRQNGSDANGPKSATEASPRLLASGSDYTPGTLRALASRAPAANAPPSPGAAAAPDLPGSALGPVPDELRRLADPTALQTCLTAITREYGGTVALVDYARFEGRPALLVLLVAAAGRTGPWVVVVGADCGLGGAITDERYNGPAG
jgi:hypothetical protein